MKTLSVLLQGPFTQADLKQIALTLRSIEQCNENQDYSMLVIDDDAKHEELKQKLAAIFPFKPGQEIEITHMKAKQ